MPITDYWGNQLTILPSQVIGYRGEIADFPHDIYSFLLSSIRDEDIRNNKLIWRWLQPMQQFWQFQYGKMLTLMSLLSPEMCPAEYLDYLRTKVGISDDLGYIWKELSEHEKRRLIKYFVRFIQYKSTQFGLGECLEVMSISTAWLRGFFDFRWIVSGDLSSQMETALGYEDDGYDPWMLSEADMPIGVFPDSIYILPVGGLSQYMICVDYFVSQMEEKSGHLDWNNPIPGSVRVRFLGNGYSAYGNLWRFFGSWYVMMDPGVVFGQAANDLSTRIQDFRISYESDPYVSDVIIEDLGTLNRGALAGLARFSRPQSEIIYLKYYKLVERFVDPLVSVEKWDQVSETTVFTEGKMTLHHDTNEVEIKSIMYNALWVNYCLFAKTICKTVGKYSDIRFMVVDDLNFYFLRVTPVAHPGPSTWELFRRDAGVDTSLDDGDLEWCDVNVAYMWRVECFVSPRPGGDVVYIRVYQDENIICEYVDSTVPWAPLDFIGAVGFAQEAAGTLEVYKVLVHPLPMEYDAVGV